MSGFRVDLEVYNGPLDLLLFLIRREEVDIYDIPIATVTEQYVGYVRLIEAIDPNLAGDFLVMAATLMEIKSRTLLPRPPLEEGDEEFLDPRVELIRQLLEYKAFKDAARTLGTAAEWQALKCPRQPALPQADSGDVDLEEVGIWDLLEAFNKLLEQTGRRAVAHEVVYDDTPLALHATDIVDSLQRADGSQRFEHIFAGRTKAELIGMFLALLELIRQRRVRAEQERPFGPIILHLLDASPIESTAFDFRSAETPFPPPASPPGLAPTGQDEQEDASGGRQPAWEAEEQCSEPPEKVPSAVPTNRQPLDADKQCPEPPQSWGGPLGGHQPTRDADEPAFSTDPLTVSAEPDTETDRYDQQ